MDSSSCTECRAIHHEFREAFAAVKESMAGQSITPADLATWVRELAEEHSARMRERSSLWATWRRWQEHRALTGHYLSPLPAPLHGIANPN